MNWKQGYNLEEKKTKTKSFFIVMFFAISPDCRSDSHGIVRHLWRCFATTQPSSMGRHNSASTFSHNFCLFVCFYLFLFIIIIIDPLNPLLWTGTLCRQDFPIIFCFTYFFHFFISLPSLNPSLWPALFCMNISDIFREFSQFMVYLIYLTWEPWR